jgi:hypothetical protein
VVRRVLALHDDDAVDVAFGNAIPDP